MNWEETRTYVAMGRTHYFTISGNDSKGYSLIKQFDDWSGFGPPDRIGRFPTLPEAQARAEQENQA